ncbi:MAG: DUF4198 domain-containing protein [Thermoanaerobaculia bacterium]
MRAQTAARILFAALLPGLASASRAHDYWLRLSNDRPPAGERVAVSHFVGEELAGEPVPRNLFAIARFEAVTPAGSRPVVGLDGVAPAGYFVADEALRTTVVYQSRNSFVELEAAKFERYLELEGLESIGALRRQLGEESRVAREAFARSAKALACAPGGDSTRRSPPAAVGLDLEIVPGSDLCIARPGDRIPFRLLLHGAPAAGLLVVARNEGAPAAALSARTDEQGRVELELGRAGFWLVKAVQMERAEGVPDVEWQSRWASLTFTLRDRR